MKLAIITALKIAKRVQEGDISILQKKRISERVNKSIKNEEEDLRIFNSMVRSLKGHEKAKEHIRKALTQGGE